MEAWRETVKMAKGNIALVQCQATIVSFLAAIIAIGWSFFNRGAIIDLDKILILCSSALVTANIACLALGNLQFAQPVVNKINDSFFRSLHDLRGDLFSQN